MKKLDRQTDTCLTHSVVSHAQQKALLLLAQPSTNSITDEQSIKGCAHTNIIILKLDGFQLEQSACSLLTASLLFVVA
jgi:hypothetical protein